MSFDPNTNRLLVANNAAAVAFASLIDAKPGSPTFGAVVKKIVFDGTGGTPNATGGIEASDYDATTNKFYLAIPELNGGGPGGVAEIDPASGAVLRVFDLATFGISNCAPTGLAVAKSGQFMLGCGNASQSIILDPTKSGSAVFVKSITEVSGEDQVWYDPTSNRWFLAARFNFGGPVLGIVDGLSDTFLQNVATTVNDHSVSVDPISGEVFVPFGADPSNAACTNGCIAVFVDVIPEPDSLALVGLALVGLFGVRRMRRMRR